MIKYMEKSTARLWVASKLWTENTEPRKWGEFYYIFGFKKKKIFKGGLYSKDTAEKKQDKREGNNAEHMTRVGIEPGSLEYVACYHKTLNNQEKNNNPFVWLVFTSIQKSFFFFFTV